MFDHKQIHMYTWERAEEKSMIDLLLLVQRMRNQVMDTRVFRGPDLGTDHYLVVARIRSLFTGWRRWTRGVYTWSRITVK